MLMKAWAEANSLWLSCFHSAVPVCPFSLDWGTSRDNWDVFFFKDRCRGRPETQGFTGTWVGARSGPIHNYYIGESCVICFRVSLIIYLKTRFMKIPEISLQIRRNADLFWLSKNIDFLPHVGINVEHSWLSPTSLYNLSQMWKVFKDVGYTAKQVRANFIVLHLP